MKQQQQQLQNIYEITIRASTAMKHQSDTIGQLSFKPYTNSQIGPCQHGQKLPKSHHHATLPNSSPLIMQSNGEDDTLNSFK